MSRSLFRCGLLAGGAVSICAVVCQIAIHKEQLVCLPVTPVRGMLQDRFRLQEKWTHFGEAIGKLQ